MGSKIIKLVDDQDGQEYYMEWSSMADAPLSYGMPLIEFREHYKEHYGTTGLHVFDTIDLPQIIKKGHNVKNVPAGVDYIQVECIDTNRAAGGESKLSKEDLIQIFCRDYQKIATKNNHFKQIKALLDLSYSCFNGKNPYIITHECKKTGYAILIGDDNIDDWCNYFFELFEQKVIYVRIGSYPGNIGGNVKLSKFIIAYEEPAQPTT